MTPLEWNLTGDIPMLTLKWSEFSILAIVFLFAIVIVFLVATLVPVFQIAGFIHAVSYVHAAGVPYVRREEVLGMAESRDLDAILESLRARGLPDEDITADPAGFRGMLRRWHAREVAALDLVSPAGIQPFIEAIQLQFETETLKGVVLRKHSRAAPEEILTEVVPFGRFDRRMLQRMAEAPGMEGFIEVLSTTPYANVLQEAFPLYSSRWSVTPLLTALDRFMNRVLRTAIGRCGGLVEAPLLLYLETRTDLTNIANAVSARANGITAEEAVDTLVHEGGSLPISLLQRMIDATNPAEGLMLLKDTPYEAFAAKIVEDESDREFISILHAIDQYWLNFAYTLGSRFPLTAGPLLEYLIGLEAGMKNLQVLLTGIARGYGSDRIERLLVTKGVFQ
ncbi:MAG: V-type ATPase subunit [Methanomicrobiales archaeon]|nr:V-type ATPase subunit [Methanomicrobiales archaeon]